MQYKRMMYLVETMPLIFLIGFIAVPKFFVLQTYPSEEGLALEIGITHRHIMPGMFFYHYVYCISIHKR